MKKEKENHNHHMGKQSGYELINGEYHIAPMYVAQFDALEDRAIGIKHMLEIVATHASEDLEQIRKQQRRVWETLADDLGIDLSKGWKYKNCVVSKIEKD